MADRRTHAPQDASTRYVFVERPRCPRCGSSSHRAYRSVEQCDGSRMKWTVCQACREKFIVVLE